MAEIEVQGVPWFVYRITCLPNGLKYYGMTCCPNARWHGHRFKRGAPCVRAMIEQYGAAQCRFEIVAWFVTKSDAAFYEKRMIVENDTVWPNGLNLVGKGRGTLLPNMTVERRDQLTEISRAFWQSDGGKERHAIAMESSAAMADARMLAGKRLAEWRAVPENAEKVRLATIGRLVSQETKDKISSSNRGRRQTPEEVEKRGAKMRGRKQTPEALKNMADARVNRVISPEAWERIRRGGTGMQRSQETRDKISAGRKAWWAAQRVGEKT